MSIVSSNMISKHYCPECESFDLSKLRRSFAQKYILNAENKLRCNACNNVFESSAFDVSTPKEVPLFLNESDSLAERSAIINPVSKPSGAASVSSDLAQSSPFDNGESQLLNNEKKSAWLYLIVTLLVLFGSAYALIWMPTSTSTSLETDTALLDTEVSEEVLEQSKHSLLHKKTKPNAEPSLLIEPETQDFPAVKKPLADVAKIVPDPLNGSLLKTSNSRLAADSSIKADIGLANSIQRAEAKPVEKKKSISIASEVSSIQLVEEAKVRIIKGDLDELFSN